MRSRLPVYAQVADMVTEEIASGRLPDGEKLPPERDMAQRFGVSVGTLRKSLAILERKDLLTRVQGSGNYVSAQGLRESIYSMFRLELHEGHGLPRADVISVDVTEKSPDLPAFGTSQRATRMRRLRYLNDTPIAVEEIWLDAGVGTLRREDVGDALYRTYQGVLGLWIAHAEDRVSLQVTPSWAPSSFGVARGEMAGFIERLGWSDADVQVEFSRTWYDPAVAVYVQRIK